MKYNIVINENKEITSSEPININLFENEVDEFVFVLPESLSEFSKVAVLQTPNRKKIELPILDDKLVISTEITSRNGRWKLCVAALKDEKLFISDDLDFIVDNSHINNETEQPLDENIELLYLELEEVLNSLTEAGFTVEEIPSILDTLEEIKKSIEELDTGGGSGGSVDLTEVLTKLDTIQNAITNLDEEDLEEIKTLINDKSHDLQQFIGAGTSNTIAQIEYNNGVCNRIDGKADDILEDLTTINDGIKDLDADLVKHATQLGNNTSTIMNTLNGFNNLIFGLQTPIYTTKDWIGDVKTKPDNTLSNWSYWGLVRAEEAKAFAQDALNNTNQILTLLQDADTLADEILTSLE